MSYGHGSFIESITIDDLNIEGVCQNIDVDVEVDVVVYHESDYGADYDGNRGVAMTCLDEFTIESVNVTDAPDCFHMSDKELMDDGELYVRVERIVENNWGDWLDKQDWSI